MKQHKYNNNKKNKTNNKTRTKLDLVAFKSFLCNKKYLLYNKYSTLPILNLHLSVNFPFIRVLIISFLRYVKPSLYFTNNYYVPLGITEGKKVSFKEKLLNKKTLSRIITIFCTGFFCKHYYQSYTHVNILIDYTNFYSIIFYAWWSCVVVYLSNLFDHLNICFIASFKNLETFIYLLFNFSKKIIKNVVLTIFKAINKLVFIIENYKRQDNKLYINNKYVKNVTSIKKDLNHKGNSFNKNPSPEPSTSTSIIKRPSNTNSDSILTRPSSALNNNTNNTNVAQSSNTTSNMSNIRTGSPLNSNINSGRFSNLEHKANTSKLTVLSSGHPKLFKGNLQDNVRYPPNLEALDAIKAQVETNKCIDLINDTANAGNKLVINKLQRDASVAIGRNAGVPLTNQALKELEKLELHTRKISSKLDSDNINQSGVNILTRFLEVYSNIDIDETESLVSDIKSVGTISTFTGSLNNTFDSVKKASSENWYNALTKLEIRSNQRELYTYNWGEDTRRLAHIINEKIPKDVAKVEHKFDLLSAPVGKILDETVIRAIFTHYPYAFALDDVTDTAEVLKEISLKRFLIHFHVCLNLTLELYDYRYKSFASTNITSTTNFLIADYPSNFTVEMYKYHRPEWYNKIYELVGAFGSQELKAYFANGKNDINSILISLDNYYNYIYKARDEYSKLIKECNNLINNNKILIGPYDLTMSSNKHKDSTYMPNLFLEDVELSKERFNKIT